METPAKPKTCLYYRKADNGCNGSKTCRWHHQGQCKLKGKMEFDALSLKLGEVIDPQKFSLVVGDNILI